MSTTALETEPKKSITLPSDQDATGRTLGDAEILNVTEAIRSGTLTSTKGRFVKDFEQPRTGRRLRRLAATRIRYLAEACQLNGPTRYH